MISQHSLYRGGNPYYNVRIWVFRDDRWQLALSQQTTIQAAAPLPAVTSKQWFPLSGNSTRGTL